MRLSWFLLMAGVTALGASPTSSPAPTGGSLDEIAVKGVVNQHRREIADCYEAGVKRNPNLHGHVEIELTIPPDGHAKKVSVAKSTMNDRGVEQCLVTAFGKWRFPTAEKETRIESFPFDFNVGNIGAGGGVKFDDDVSRVAKAHSAQTQRCFDEAHGRDPKRAGRMTVRITVEKDGTVKSVRMTYADVGDDKFYACIVNEVVTWKFPKSTDGMIIQDYPFEMEPAR